MPDALTPEQRTLHALVVEYLRRPSLFTNATGTLQVGFTPPLTPEEQATLDRLRALARSAVQIKPAEWEAIEADIAGLRTYQNLPSPTLAQTVLAVKAQSRILRALLRD